MGACHLDRKYGRPDPRCRFQADAVETGYMKSLGPSCIRVRRRSSDRSQRARDGDREIGDGFDACLIAALRFRGSLPNYSLDLGILSVAWINVFWCRYSAHICEAFGIFPWMRSRSEGSIGHYLDLGSTLLCLTLFPLRYCLYALHEPVFMPNQPHDDQVQSRQRNKTERAGLIIPIHLIDDE